MWWWWRLLDKWHNWAVVLWCYKLVKHSHNRWNRLYLIAEYIGCHKDNVNISIMQSISNNLFWVVRQHFTCDGLQKGTKWRFDNVTSHEKKELFQCYHWHTLPNDLWSTIQSIYRPAEGVVERAPCKPRENTFHFQGSHPSIFWSVFIYSNYSDVC